MESYAETLAALASTGNLRRIPAETGTEALDLSSNDYLGLAADTRLLAEFTSQLQNGWLPFTSSASRLLAARQREYEALESRLSELYGREALLFNSGYHANTGLISALASLPGTMIVADKLAHASIIDGMTLSRAPFQRFRHNDFDHLERILAKEQSSHKRILVAVESVYSMDGDTTDLDALVALKRRYPSVMLYVDEAHAVGVEGERGLGLARQHACYDEIEVVVGTFGKALASMGAFAVMNSTLHDFAVNRSRALIFSTALPPVVCAWTLKMLETSLTMDAERSHLRHLATLLAEGTGRTASHIQPVIIGNAEATLSLSAELLERGFKVLPIRTPTVPPGTERLRISLSAAMSDDDIRSFRTTLDSLT